MSLMSWNCRGLGNPWTVRDLCQMVKEKRPVMVFLMETKLRHNKMERVQCKLGFWNMLVVGCVGKSGGLALLWGDKLEVEIQNYSQRHINAKISSPISWLVWKCTGFYGNPESGKRGEAWDLLRYLSTIDPVPWVCVGEFNEILNLSEKWGGNECQRGLMEAFQSTLEECRLLDLGYRGQKFTWNNGREGNDFVKERLDRVVANEEWCEIFLKVDVGIEEELSSDHCPVHVTLQEDMKRRRRTHLFLS
jgi:exonuclease III